MATRIPRSQFSQRFDLPNWRLINHSLVTDFVCGDFASGARFIVDVAVLADEADHHPDVDLRFPGTVRVSVSSHDANGLTERDAALASAIDAMAQRQGLIGTPGKVGLVEIAIDAMNIEALLPFWRAVTNYVDEPPAQPGDPVDALIDPSRRLPPLWFQQMDEPRPQRSRTHIDIRVPHDEADARVAAAIAAGGRLLTDQYARAFWVLADPEGNEVCVCTWQDRD
jgi:4a-hydroxytetrahydrobiopterin dehydratase